ncbi:MAG: DUF2817 domain-containing protein [Alphaproteobacteria bacterium]|jgi:hypothetical protein|nr:DUF2817 domain-containing protein [Alphaproteobacteria bacterium]
MNPADFFRPDYAACRELFLQLGEGGDELIHAINPAPGPDGLELSTEFLRLGPRDAERALIMVSGTHGAEGFAGSAVQCAWLAKYAENLPDNLAVVMVHGLNAFGFAHLRRVNENNVDLNRNFIDHEGAHPHNEGYAKIGAVMAANAVDGPDRTKADQALEALREEMGQMNVMRAIGGQYDVAEGMFYGGRIPVWSNRALREHLPQLLPNVKLAAYVDIHTGLGPSGHGSAMGYHHKETADYDLAQKWWGAGMTATASKINHGKTGNGAIEALEPARVICLTLEFGTLPFSDVLAALRDEHALWWHGKGRDGRAIKSAMKTAFFREDAEWKASVIERGLQISSDSIHGLNTA